VRHYFESWTGVSLIKIVIVFSIVGCLLSFGFDIIDDGSIDRPVGRYVERSLSGALIGIALVFVVRLLIPEKRGDDNDE
jgi:hypothetical protein